VNGISNENPIYELSRAQEELSVFCVGYVMAILRLHIEEA
jgi:hypothetical protein